MMTIATGQAAEAFVAEHLAQEGFKIIDKNWRRRRAEIDIIAEKDKVMYFIEVKFRRTDRQGTGLEYITKAKLKQMKFAAELWVSENDHSGDWRLMAAAVELRDAQMEISELLDVS